MNCGRGERPIKHVIAVLPKYVSHSLATLCHGGRALIGLGSHQDTKSFQTPNAVDMYRGSQPTRDKLRRREGNNPDQQLRSQSATKCIGCGVAQTARMLLRSSHHLKSGVIAHWSKGSCADNVRD